MNDAMFDTSPYETAEPVDDSLSPDRRRTLKRRQLLDRGIHPATRVPIKNGPDTCGSCIHSVKINSWWKCDRVILTAGPASDIRVSWPACAKWEGQL